ncbi:MAG: SpoIVB peptidase S55 domain-containing protein [Bryobacteraceae bacterium]
MKVCAALGLASLVLVAAGAAAAATPFFPLQDVKAGMKGVGKTVFSGDRIEDFQVEILGVLDNFGPSQSLILGKLSGGSIERTGVMQGMSGSPVYIDGKLLGAVAMAFPFSKEPIAGIRPIAEMIPVGDFPSAVPARIARPGADLLAGLPKRTEAVFGTSKLAEISTPVSFSGFTRETIERFAPQLRTLGLEPQQGVSGGGRVSSAMGNPAALKPGSMISVQLVTGDLSIGADGTVTHIDGDKVYAFGHRFMAIGTTELPFARAEVLTLLPSVQTSFKISTSKELMGVISQDRNTAVAGVLGRRAAMVPVSIRVAGAGGKRSAYQMKIVEDRFLSPFLLQMTLASALDATERATGPGTLVLKGKVEFEGNLPALDLENTFAADAGSSMQAALAVSTPLAWVLQGGFDALRVKQVSIDITSLDRKKQMQVDQVFPGRREAKPGEDVELLVSLAGENGAEVTRKVKYRVPAGLQPGPLYFTVGDASSSNVNDLRQLAAAIPKSAAQLIASLNRLRTNTKAYVRVWRADAAYQLHGDDYPDPPPSMALIFGRAQTTYGGLTQVFNSKLAEMEIDGGGALITGSKTVQVDVKE